MSEPVPFIEVTSGVSMFTGDPFCLVVVRDPAGAVVAEGQLSPAEARGMAQGWLEAAEGAISDAAVYKLLRDKIDVPDDLAAVFITDLRALRVDLHEAHDDGPSGG